jgi:hypothetical protein
MPAASIADTKSDNDCCGMGIPFAAVLWGLLGDVV